MEEKVGPSKGNGTEMSTFEEMHPELEISSKVEISTCAYFEEFYPLHRSGVACMAAVLGPVKASFCFLIGASIWCGEIYRALAQSQRW